MRGPIEAEVLGGPMTMHVPSGPAAAEGARVCECGATLAGGQFCPECGRRVAAYTADGPFPRHEAATGQAAAYVDGFVPPPATAGRPLLDDIEDAVRGSSPSTSVPARRRWPIAVAVGLLVVAVGA